MKRSLVWAVAVSFSVQVLLSELLIAGTLWHVDSTAKGKDTGLTWVDAFTDLRDATDLAQPGDTIFVAVGIYRPDRGSLSRADSFVIPGGVAMAGGFPIGGGTGKERDPFGNRVILTGDLLGNDQPEFVNTNDNSFHVVRIANSNEVANLSGFSIRNGAANGNPGTSDADGGGLLIEDASVVIDDCDFTANSARRGGGIGVRGDAGTLLLRNCEITSNIASLRGGGVNLGSGGFVAEHTIFYGNRASTLGGALNVGTSGATVTDCFFVNNEVESSDAGGAIFLPLGAGMTARDSTFIHNKGGLGGAIRTEPNATLPRVLSRCVFAGNEGGRSGGAVSASGATTVENCLFAGNAAEDDGGAVWLEASGGLSATMVNCTIAFNNAEDSAGGIFSAGGSPAIGHSILWGNTAGLGSGFSAQYFGFGGSPVLYYNDIEGWAPNNGGVGNMNLDPLFVDPLGPDGQPKSLDEDLRLRAGSPLVNAGDPALPFPTDAVDLLGAPRVNCGVVDIGAYEGGVADVNCDGDVGLSDYADLRSCLTGPIWLIDDDACRYHDYRRDDHVDLRDVAEFQNLFSPE